MSEQEEKDQKLWESFLDMLNAEPVAVMRTLQAKDKELAELRAWKEKAMPFIEEALENFESYMYSQRLVAKGLTKENQETHAILTELIKGEE